MVAEDTGGGYFELSRAENLATTFAEVAEELHHQYAMGFEPAKLDDKMHKLEVKVKRSGMKIRARKELCREVSGWRLGAGSWKLT
jgi:hypothetical protein